MDEDDIMKSLQTDIKIKFVKEDGEALEMLKTLVTEAKDGSFRKVRDEMEIAKNAVKNKSIVKK